MRKSSAVIVCAHDSLFHVKAEAIGTVGLLVIDEGFWQAGLRGLDGKAKLTLDGLEPVRSSPACYTRKNKLNIEGTADLVAARMKLWKALHVSEPGVLRHGLLAATGLTVEECQKAAALEHRRLRNAGLLPGMAAAERRARIAKIMPPDGIPWAPPGRCATLWLILAEALETGHDAAGVELFHELTEAGSVKSLRLRWRSRLRGGWAKGVPILHLDATLRPELVEPYLPLIEIRALLAARQPHVRVRQVTQSPTSAKALTPLPEAPERDRTAAASHLRDLRAWITLRARQCQSRAAEPAVLVIGQKAADRRSSRQGTAAERRRRALQWPEWPRPLGRHPLPDRARAHLACTPDRRMERHGAQWPCAGVESRRCGLVVSADREAPAHGGWQDAAAHGGNPCRSHRGGHSLVDL